MTRASRSWPRCVHLAGADGSGKSTQARALVARMRADGLRARRVWLRHPRLLSIPFLVFARCRGYSRYETVDGARHGYWDFSSSWVLSVVFPWALLADAWAFALVKVYLPLWLHSRVVCDRFALDTLVDLMVGLRDPRLDERRAGRLFLALIPAGCPVVVLDLEVALAELRSPELGGDRVRSERRRAYLELARRHGFPVVSAEPPQEAVTESVVEALATAARTADVRYYSVSGAPLLRPLLRRKSGALATYWLFQGLLYMDRSERLFKLGLDVLLTVAIAAPLRLALPAALAWPLAAVLAHTANFLVNGQIWVVLKHFGGVRHTTSEFEHEVARLRRHLATEPSIIYAAAYGSIARDEWKETSDLDVRLVRAPGLRSALRSCWFATRERSRALIRRFPLDVYVLDGPGSLRKLAERDAPVVLRNVHPKRAP